MKISKRPDHTRRLFLKRTIAAQIHFLTFLLAFIGLLFLYPHAINLDPAHFWAVVIFGITGMAVFLISATYHFMMDGYDISPRLWTLMEHLDHSAIYLFIAGTYTPILVNVIAEPWQTILMIAIWTMAILGILYTNLKHKLPLWAQKRGFYTMVYVMMALLLLVRISEAWSRLSTFSASCLLAGVLTYLVGAGVFAYKRPRLLEGLFGYHELWHFLVMIGFLFHYVMVYSLYSKI